MLRKLLLGVLATLLMFIRADATASDNAACCLPTTSRLDALMNPTTGSDEKFFARPGGPPNVLFVIDTSASMDGWPQPWPTERGCNDSFLNSLGYNSSELYPRLKTGIGRDSPNWFQTDTYYEVRVDGTGKAIGYGTAFGGEPLGQKWATAADACGATSILGITVDDQALCTSCLANRGYYVHDATTRRVRGNFLNLYAPRDSGAVKVLTEVVHDLREVRFGILSTRTEKTGACWGNHSTTNNQCVCVQADINPTCDKSYPLDQSSVESNRNSILNALTNTKADGTSNTPGNGQSLAWGGCGSPLADLLYSAGYYFQSKTSPTPYQNYLGTHSTTNNTEFNTTKGVCFECGFNAIILLTGGTPADEWKVIPRPDYFTNDTTSCTDCSASDMHKVAKLLWSRKELNDANKRTDLHNQLGGEQSVATYTIGFSASEAANNLLRETARLGGGQFHTATSSSVLKQRILTILDDINSRNTSFSAAAISSLQVQGSVLNAVIPRMQPAKDKPWFGELYRYEQFNEFVEDADRNGDGDKADIFLTDKDLDIVAENTEGQFRKVTLGAGGTATISSVPAVPYWEGRNKLVATGHQNRKIWTVTDNGQANGAATVSADNALTEADALVEFNLDNIAKLKSYLGVYGAPLCPTVVGGLMSSRGFFLDKIVATAPDDAKKTAMNTALNEIAGKIGITYPPTSQANADLFCAGLLIRYVRGQDLFNEDLDTDYSDTRTSVLGDIFHSSPVLVNPPVDKFLCDIGINNQCIRTLYSKQLGVTPTPLDDRSDLPTSCNVATLKARDAYDAYHFMNRKRERLILVGANDGMLHAFSDGQGTEDVSSCEIKYKSDATGGGEERWAFIPPDLLPRLQDMIRGHSYFVDGDIMVRDIWADENKDGRKSWDEFRTLAVVAEGRGGTHYFALELLWNTVSNTVGQAKDRPGFRWMFPQPCTNDALRFGKTLLSLSPKPPPIGPVLLKTTSSTGQIRHGVNTLERWVVMVSGGWSPGQEKGRGVYMVDAWNGKVNDRGDNLLWRWDFKEGATGNAEEPRKYMTHSIVAPVAFVDYGSNTEPTFDGFFDTAVVGDLGGQLWTLRFFKPGELDSTTKLVSNWSGARSFVMDRQETYPSHFISKRWPFYYLSSLAIQPGRNALRAFVGTGNRYALVENSVGTCRFDNPQACSKRGCNKTQVFYNVTRSGSSMTMSNEWEPQKFKEGKGATWSSAPTNFCGTTSTPDFVTADFTTRSLDKCKRPSGGGAVSYELAETMVKCGQDSSGNFACRVTDPGNTINMRDIDVPLDDATLGTLGKNRFYGVWVYGGKPERRFDNDSTSTNQAKQYDGRRLTDSGGTTTWGDLINVTDLQCDKDGKCTCKAGGVCGSPKLMPGEDDAGWFFEYPGMPEKTASGSAVLASCALWNSIYPVNTSTSSACQVSNNNKARFHQGEYITGAPNCAAGLWRPEGYLRYQERDVVAPPPEPATAIQVSKTGKVKYSTLIVEPGQTQATEIQVSGDMDILQSIYELPVSRSLHECRHDTGSAACIPSEM